MMKRTDYERTLAKSMELIKAAAQPGEAMRALIDFTAGIFNDRFLTAIRNLPFDRDVDQLESWLAAVLTKEPVPAEINAYWFGLFNPILQGVATSCLYVAGSNRFTDDEENVDWACSPKYFPDDRYSNSGVLMAIYRAHEECREKEGEYFCLWYASIAVPTLCRRLADVLLGEVERRAVAIGFDSGDVVMLGTLTASGFEPLEYVPPCVPTIAPTPNDALFYELKDDVRGRWWLEHPTEADGDDEDIPFGLGTHCERIELEMPLFIAVDEDAGGAPVRFTFATMEIPVVRADAAALVQSRAGNGIQLIPVTVVGESHQHYILNILSRVGCLDLLRSTYLLKGARKAKTTDAAEVDYVIDPVIDERRAGTHHIFRLGEDEDRIVVSRELKTQLESACVTGIKFKPLQSVSGE